MLIGVLYVRGVRGVRGTQQALYKYLKDQRIQHLEAAKPVSYQMENSSKGRQ